MQQLVSLRSYCIYKFFSNHITFVVLSLIFQIRWNLLFWCCQVKDVCCIIRPGFGVRSTPNAGRNSHFQWKMTQSSSDSQLFIGKNVFLEKKAHFLGKKNSRPAFWCKLKKHVFCKILLQIFCFFSFFAQKNDEFPIF